MERINRRYILACNSAYDYNRYWTIRFNEDDTTTFTDVGIKYNLQDKKVFKNTLAEIDSMTCRLTEPVFIQHVLKKGPIFISKVGNITIFYKKDNEIREIKPVFNNPLLASKLHLVQKDRIYDKEEVDSAVRLIENPNLDFVDFACSEKELGNTALSGTMLKIMKELRRYAKILQNHDSIAVRNEIDVIRENVKETLTYYKEYREMLLLKQRYLEPKTKTTSQENIIDSTYQQFTFFPSFGEEVDSTKRKRR